MIKYDLKHIDQEQIMKCLFFAVLFLGAFIRLAVLLNSDNFHGIAAGKVVCAQSLVKHPYYLESWIIPAHGPIHIYLVAFLFKLSNDPIFVPRLISLFSGIGFIAVYYYFIKKAFNQKIALLSSFLMAFFPLHINHSVLSTAEASFLFLLCIGLFFMEEYLNRGRDKYLVFSAVFISMASMCRFEGGLFIVFVSLFLIKQYKKIFLFLSIALIMPLIWMVLNFIYSGSFLLFLSASDSIVQTEFEYLRDLGRNVTFFTKLFYWPSQLSAYFGWPVFLIGLFGLIKMGYKKNKRILFLFLMIISFFIFKTVREELAMQPRYGLSLAILFVPFFSLAFVDILGKINLKKRSMLVFIFIIYILLRGTYLTAVGIPKTPDWLVQAGAFLHDNLEGDNAVFIDAEEDNYKDPLKLQANTDIDRFIDKNHFFRHMELMDPLGRERLKYIVLISERKMHNLKQVFKAWECKIYEVK